PSRPVAATRRRVVEPGPDIRTGAACGLGVTNVEGLQLNCEVRRGAFDLRLTLSAAPGEVVGVLGPNGAGKSTLLRALAGLTPISSGQIAVDGVVLDEPATATFVPADQRRV